MIAALLSGGMGLLLFVGAKQQRRRRDRRRPTRGPRRTRELEPPATAGEPRRNLGADWQGLFTICAVAAVVFLAFGVLAFTHPASKPGHHKTPYTEKVSFGYHAKRPAGPVYPDGVVARATRSSSSSCTASTSRLTTACSQGPADLGGTMEVVLRLASPTGWSRTIQLAAPKRFTGDYAAPTDARRAAAAVADPQGREAHRQLAGASYNV